MHFFAEVQKALRASEFDEGFGLRSLAKLAFPGLWSTLLYSFLGTCYLKGTRMKYKSILASPWLLQSPDPFQDLLVNMVKIQRSFSYFFIYWLTHLYTSINACVHSLRRAFGQDKQDKPSQAKPHKLKFLNLCPTKSLAHSKLVPTENQVQDKLSSNSIITVLKMTCLCICIYIYAYTLICIHIPFKSGYQRFQLKKWRSRTEGFRVRWKALSASLYPYL